MFMLRHSFHLFAPRVNRVPLWRSYLRRSGTMRIRRRDRPAVWRRNADFVRVLPV